MLKSKLPLGNKMHIYYSMLRPILFYGAQIWDCAKSTQLKTR